MPAFINWIKRHKLLVLFALIIAYLLSSTSYTPIGLRSKTSFGMPMTTESNYIDSMPDRGMTSPSSNSMSGTIGMAPQNYQPVSDSTNRVVIKESSLSLLVKNVRETGDKIISTAKNMGGYMVSVSYNNPSEQGFATISVRVPTNQLDEALGQFRSSAIKVTSENLVGTDVTQEYQDLDQRTATLKVTKAKFEEILKKAITVDEILRVNQEIINLEQQLDYTTGQKLALADNARLTKITLFLSTDELALPYTPDKTFRPDVIFKLAVRSLLSTVQSIAELAIWIGVFAIIWLPALLLTMYLYKRKKTKLSASMKN